MLLGSSPVFPKLLAWAAAKGVPATVVTSPDQAAEVAVSGVRDARVVEEFTEDLIKEGIAISFGARWIFRKPVIEGFNGRLLNAHGTRLPIDRGGGGFSWRIMRGDRIGALLLHQVTEGIDTGPIVAIEDYVVPRDVQTPSAMMAAYVARLEPFVIRFLEAGAPLVPMHQVAAYSTYYPRLSTPLHSWIDWSWEPEEIERFILAFDDPYPGARTRWRNGLAILKRAQLHRGEVPHHPFQAGLVIRNNGRWLVVAVKGDASLIVEDVRDDNGSDLRLAIKEGDRLFTPREMLDAAIAQRVTVGPLGAKKAR